MTIQAEFELTANMEALSFPRERSLVPNEREVEPSKKFE